MHKGLNENEIWGNLVYYLLINLDIEISNILEGETIEPDRTEFSEGKIEAYEEVISWIKNCVDNKETLFATGFSQEELDWRFKNIFHSCRKNS